jgi:hypothetical protein
VAKQMLADFTAEGGRLTTLDTLTT